MNGKKTELTRHDTTPNENNSIKEFNEEHAATVEDSDIPELIRQDSDNPDNTIYFTRKSKFRSIKPFLLATLSAVLIGSFLGFFMLNMFVDINDDISRQGGSSPLAASSDEEEDNTSDDDNGGSYNGDDDMSPVTIESRNAFILQAGKFSEKENADEMVSAFQQEGFPAMVWEKDEYFFVLSGITNSKEQGLTLANAFAEKDLEVYVNEWGTESGEIELSNQEREWIQAYELQWKDALTSVNDGNKLSQDAWSNVVDEIPENSEHITEFADFLKEQHQQMGSDDKWKDQVVLLRLWEQFNQLVLQ